MSGGCLGDKVADLVDGRLSAAETERAYAHVAGCDACRAAVEAQRSVSGALGSVGDPAPPGDLFDRLRALPPEVSPLWSTHPRPETAPAVPLAGLPEQGGAGVRPVGPAGLRPGARGEPSRRSRRTKVALASAAGAAALAVVAVVGGSGTLADVVSPAPPAIAPVVDAFTVEHAVTTDRMPLSGPRYETVGYLAPSASTTASPAP